MSRKWIALGWIAVMACSSPQKRETPKKKVVSISLSATKVARGARLYLKASALAEGLEVWQKDSLLLTTSFDTLSLSTQDMSVGKKQLRIKALLADSIKETHYISLQILASSTAKHYSYFLYDRYPHDEKAYTQGLLLHNDVLYEGTGQRGSSYLQKRSWPKGEILQTVHLADDIFGEGIALKGDTIYQLSWQAHKGTIYSAKTLTKLGEFSYPTEGWGLTRWKKYLVMSDGSEHLYFYLTQPWRHSHTLQIYDHKGPVSAINELETVGENIYANQYGRDILLIIDPRNGELIGQIDASTLFDKDTYEKETDKKVDVLNGIAYDEETERLLLTGKLWPYLYEVVVADEPLP